MVFCYSTPRYDNVINSLFKTGMFSFFSNTPPACIGTHSEQHTGGREGRGGGEEEGEFFRQDHKSSCSY